MAIEIREIKEITDPIEEAMALLIPQLSPELEPPSRGQLHRIVSDQRTVLFAAVSEERIAGVLTLTWYDIPSGRKAWIEDVVVDSAARGRGAGEALIRAAVEHAARIGAAKVQLTSNPARQAAHALYRKIGFAEVKTGVFVLKTA